MQEYNANDITKICNELNGNIHIDGKKIWSSADTKPNLLSESCLIKIIDKVLIIEELTNKGITTDNQNIKIKQYDNFVKKAFEEWGINIEPKYPFYSLTMLYDEIDEILNIAGFTPDQKKTFYTDTNIRKRSPKKIKKIGILESFGIKKDIVANQVVIVDDERDEYEEYDKLEFEHRYQIEQEYKTKLSQIEQEYKTRLSQKKHFKLIKHTP